jgi:uncharacterized protein
MLNRLPVRIDPLRLAETGQLLSGTLALADMKRLAASLASSEGEVEVELEFGKDVSGVPYMKGHLKTELRLVCQRCLEPLEYPVNSDFLLGIVSSEAECELLPADYEPLELREEAMSLSDIIEDELLLSLPIVAMHPQSECHPRGGSDADEQNGATNETGEKLNPFAVLADLKKRTDE